MSKLFKTIFVVPLFLLTVLFSFTEVQASETGSVGYSVKAELPENQHNDQVSYFDLRVEPNQEQTIEVTVTNQEDSEITVLPTIVNASTNRNGIIIYTEQEEIDSSLKQPLTEIATIDENEITIPANESKTVEIDLTLPEEPFDGIKLGGINFIKAPEEQEAAEGVSVQNEYAYLIGLQLSENDDEIENELTLNGVNAELVNYRPAVVAQIQNPQPKITNEVNIEANIYEAGGSEVVKTKTQENVVFAPNTTMDFVVEWENDELEAGDYRIEMTATRGEEVWEWTENFTIEPEQEQQINEEAVDMEPEEDTSWPTWLTIVLVAAGLIIIALIIYVIRLRKKVK